MEDVGSQPASTRHRRSRRAREASGAAKTPAPRPERSADAAQQRRAELRRRHTIHRRRAPWAQPCARGVRSFALELARGPDDAYRGGSACAAGVLPVRRRRCCGCWRSRWRRAAGRSRTGSRPEAWCQSPSPHHAWPLETYLRWRQLLLPGGEPLISPIPPPPEPGSLPPTPLFQVWRPFPSSLEAVCWQPFSRGGLSYPLGLPDLEDVRWRHLCHPPPAPALPMWESWRC